MSTVAESCACGAQMTYTGPSAWSLDAERFRRDHRHIEPTPLRPVLAATRTPITSRRYVSRRLRITR